MAEAVPFRLTVQRLQRRTVRVLVVAQLFGACGLAAGGTAGALLAEQLTGSLAAAGLPLSLLVLGSGVGAVVVTRVMSVHGRRAGLAAAYLAGAVGAGLVVAAAAFRSWPLLLAGCGLLGSGNTAVMLARYAAADLASRRGRAISAVVAAASVGAVAGPNLLGPAGALAGVVGLPAPTGLFLLAIPAFLGAALVLVVFLRPDPLQVAWAAAPSTQQPAVAGGMRELASLLGDRHIRLALLVLAVANLSMVGVMAVAPVHLHDQGAGMGTIGLLISAHIAAMYLPSPVTGWLADAIGGRLVAGMGALLLLAAGAAAVAAAGRGGIAGALLLLGVGWNAGLIGGSALLHDAAVSPSLRTRAEGLGELGMGAAAAVGGSGAGLLLATGGLGLLGLVAAAPCLLILAAAFRPDDTHLHKRLLQAVRDRSRTPYEAGANTPQNQRQPLKGHGTGANTGPLRGGSMLHPSEALARYRIRDLLSEAEHAQLVARLRSLQRARRAARRTAAIPALTSQLRKPTRFPGPRRSTPVGRSLPSDDETTATLTPTASASGGVRRSTL